MMKSRKYNLHDLKNTWSSRRLLAILIVGVLVFSLFGALISSDGGKVKISSLTIDSRGAELNIDQYVPAGVSDSDKLPCILLAHGRGVTKNVLRGVAEEMARRGFVVLNVSGYGMGLSEQPVNDDAGQGAKSFMFFKGSFGELDALNFARTLKYVDPTRIAMYGHSMGSSRIDSVAIADSGYYTFNDVMINVLADTFGQTFTKDEISQDADKLASSRLNADQLTYYKSIYIEKKAAYDTRLNTIVLSGSTNIPKASTVKVGGYDVTRECQVNAILINGKYDPMGPGATWNSDGTTKPSVLGGAQIANWYQVSQDGSKYTKIGALDSANILNTPALVSAIKSRSTRIACYPDITHSEEYFSNAQNTYAVKTLSQVLNYNRGNLTDTNTKPLDPNSNIWFLRALCNLIAMLCMLAMIFPIISLLTKTKFFAPCIMEQHESKSSGINKAAYWIFAGLTAISTVLILYKANTLGPQWASGIQKFPPNIFRLVTTSAIAFWFIIMMAAASLILVIAKVIFIKKSTGDFGLREMNIKIKFTVFLKTVLIGIIVIAATNAMLVVIERLFNQDFRFFQTMFSQMKIEQWLVAIPYMVSFFVLYLIIGLSINYRARTDISERKEMILNIVINSIGVWVLFIIDLLMQANWNGKPFSDFSTSYSMLFLVPLTVFINRKLYKKTHSIWLGALINAMLLSWMMVSSMGMADAYYGQNIISVIFGV
jgi:hypothetical protein